MKESSREYKILKYFKFYSFCVYSIFFILFMVVLGMGKTKSTCIDFLILVRVFTDQYEDQSGEIN